MPEDPAIRLRQVCKTYRLYGSQRDQLIDVLGLRRIGIRPGRPTREFAALSDISLEVPRGHRIGIVGRNGAGKTTLLKLICGNFAPTSGEVEVRGAVQALLGMGLGFHPEYTGRENIVAALQYNGLTAEQHREAIEDIVEFCELGEFIDQPFRTYSSGMQARLMFSAATAVNPDILIVDEVLGAGDAYFIAKSKLRVERLVGSGCTMLLVSHSMAQVLELCKEAIWLDQGCIRMQGEAFLVVKAYEEFLHRPIGALQAGDALQTTEIAATGAALAAPPMAPGPDSSVRRGVRPVARLQEPAFQPHAQAPVFPAVSAPSDFQFVAPGGVSRWDGVAGLKIFGFSMLDEDGVTNKVRAMRPAKILLNLRIETAGDYRCRYAICIYDLMGRCVADVLSPCDSFRGLRGGTRTIEAVFNPVQLGPGQYTVSVSAHEYAALEVFNSTPRFDLISRSFSLFVELPESLRPIEAHFYHSAEWSFGATLE